MLFRGGGVGYTPGTMWLVPAFLATGAKADVRRMKLLRQPRPPRNDGFYIPYNLLHNHGEWQKYLPSLN
jgi:hypothetical protein